MKKFILKKDFNKSLAAVLDLRDMSSREIWEAFPIINSWVKDITDGEINIDPFILESITSTSSTNFTVWCEAGLLRVYKVEKPIFHIKEIV